MHTCEMIYSGTIVFVWRERDRIGIIFSRTIWRWNALIFYLFKCVYDNLCTFYVLYCCLQYLQQMRRGYSFISQAVPWKYIDCQGIGMHIFFCNWGKTRSLLQWLLTQKKITFSKVDPPSRVWQFFLTKHGYYGVSNSSSCSDGRHANYTAVVPCHRVCGGALCQ